MISSVVRLVSAPIASSSSIRRRKRSSSLGIPPPRTHANIRSVKLPEKVQIVDVGPRDGFQTEQAFIPAVLVPNTRGAELTGEEDIDGIRLVCLRQRDV